MNSQIDVTKIIQELLNTGMTKAEIAQEIGVHDSLITKWETGNRNPKFGKSTGDKLIDLHRKVVR